MSVGSAKAGRLNFSEVATFSTTAPVGGSTWVHIDEDGLALPVLTQNTDDAIRGNTVGASTPPNPTTKRSTMDFVSQVFTGTLGLDGTGGDSNPTSCYLMNLLESYFGEDASAAFTGTTVAAASGAGRTAALKVASASNLRVGNGLMVNGEARHITAISGTDITLNADLASTPAENDVVYGSFRFRPALGHKAEYIYLNAERDGHGWMLGPGKVIGLKLQGLAAGSGLRYAMHYEGDTWVDAVTISSFTRNAFSGTPIVSKNAQVILDTTAICILDGEIDFGIQQEWKECATGSQGTQGLQLFGQEGASATFTEYYANTRFDQMEAQTAIGVQFMWTVGSTNAAKARGAISVFMPNATFKVAEATAGNKQAQSVTVKAHLPTAAQVTAGITNAIYLDVFGGV